MDLDFIWVAVTDIERSVDFYNEFLETEPESISERMAYYDLENIGFGLYDPSYDNWQPKSRGDNMAPAFHTNNYEEEKERVADLAGEIQEYDAGDHKGFLFKDPDGNGLEVYTWCE